MWKSPQQIEVEAQAHLEWLQQLASQPLALPKPPKIFSRQRLAKLLRVWADYVDTPQRSLQ
jgi:Ser/Thr protein kinase RdoA (MazF antagonist)